MCKQMQNFIKKATRAPGPENQKNEGLNAKHPPKTIHKHIYTNVLTGGFGSSAAGRTSSSQSAPWTARKSMLTLHRNAHFRTLIST